MNYIQVSSGRVMIYTINKYHKDNVYFPLNLFIKSHLPVIRKKNKFHIDLNLL